MPVTEIGGMRVRPGLNPLDDSTPEGQIVSEVYKKIASEPTGPYRVYYGLEVENPEYFWGFFDFASVEDHKKFAQEHAGPLVRDLGKVFMHSTEPRDLAALFMSHIQPEPQPTPSSDGAISPFPFRSIRSSITEIMLAFFPADISPQAKKSATNVLQQFIDQGLNKCADVQAVDYGWAIETDVPVRGTGGGDGEKDGNDTSEPHKGALLWAGIGWPGIEAHEQFCETDAFKNSVGLLREMEGLVSITMFHVKFRGWENTVRKE